MPHPHAVELWIDPSCPWAWQGATWLLDLQDQGAVSITWKLFSLELNASELGAAFWTACERHGESLVSLALARREGGDEAFEHLYVALGTRVHLEKEPVSPELLRDVAGEAGFDGLPDRAVADPTTVQDVLADHRAARDRSVFGVPTFTVDGSKSIYGPILPLAPRGEEAAEWWEHVRWLADRPDFFELKRWPRDIKPGQDPSQA